MIQRMVLHDMIVKEVKKYIINHNLEIGDKLPPQQEFAKMFGLSRTSFREATRTMQALNIIEIINGKGMYVKNNNFILEDTPVGIEDKKKQLLLIIEVRRAIEGLATELATQNATEEDLALMEKNLLIMEEHAKKSEPHPEYDRAFHNAIFNASKNPILVSTVNYLSSQFDVLWENPIGAGDALTEGTYYHRELFEAIKSRNESKVRETFKKLIDQVEIIINNI